MQSRSLHSNEAWYYFRMSLRKRPGGFRFALNGIAIAWREEANFRFHTAAAVVTLCAGLIFQISRIEWLILLVLIGAVITSELINTAFEELCDMLKTEHDPHIAKIKDIAAGAVLVVAAIALIGGALIFLPHLLHLFS